MNVTEKRHFKVALVGVEFEENLSLRYLAGALMHAGYSQVVIQPYNSILEAEEIVDHLIKENFDLVGVSMAFQVRAIDDMALVQLLRKRGFSRHVTAGGQFATLHYREIFQDCSGLESIIRFEAETAIVELADSLLQSAGLDAVSGLVWKDLQNEIHVNSTVPSPGDIDALPLPFRKTNRLEVLGLKRVHMIGSRGCHATCKYCCVSALATERRDASRDAGGLTAIPGTRRRTAENIAAEMAYLYFKHDIRVFEFQDDNWIHPKVSLAIEYFTTLKNELDKKGVGKIGITLKTRADSVQPEIIGLLKELGLIRVFVGIESGTQNLLSKLGRKSRDNVSLQALQVLREFRIPAYFNALLFGPDIKFEEIEPELQFLDQCTSFPFEVVEVVIYGKTGLYQSLKAENRLHGHYLDYEYDYLDRATQIMHALIRRLDTRHFGVYSPVKMMADVGFNLGILQVFYPGDFTDNIAIKVDELTSRINHDQLRVIRKAASVALVPADLEAASEDLLAETISADLQFYREIIELQAEIERYVSSMTNSTDVHAYYRLGAMVNSGFLAGLFMLLSGQVHGQIPMHDTIINEKLKDDIVQYILNPSAKEWKQLEKRLLAEKTPILYRYPWDVLEGVTSIDKAKGLPGYTHLEGIEEFEKKVNALHEIRVKQDFERLNAILLEHQPKIRIASSLVFEVDEAGKVDDMYANGADEKKALTPELKQLILDILKDKNFYAYEVIDSFSGPKAYPKARKKWRPFKKKKKYMRRGPLD